MGKLSICENATKISHLQIDVNTSVEMANRETVFLTYMYV